MSLYPLPRQIEAYDIQTGARISSLAATTTEAGLAAHLELLGGQLRRRRKSLGVSATTTAKAAGLSRTTLHRIESGEPSVTIGAYANVAAALGLEMALRAPGEQPAGPALPLSIRPADYPKLAELAWQRDPTITLTHWGQQVSTLIQLKALIPSPIPCRTTQADVSSRQAR